MWAPFDYHSHNRRCGHAEGELADYARAARAAGLETFGFSDHCPAYFLDGDKPLPGTMMGKSELAGYVNEALALKEQGADRLDLRVGIEADWVPGFHDAYRDALAAHPFDYVLGSVHWVNGRSIFDRSRWADENADATYAAYYRLVIEAAQTGLFDILSHLTAVEAYGPPIGEATAAQWYPAVADAAVDAGCVIEVNTSGYRKMNGDEPFPNRRLLALLIARNVPLTFGSDCHRPGDVGWGRERVAALLESLGVDTRQTHHVTVRRGPIRAFTTTTPTRF